MKLTVIPSDGIVGVDRVFRAVDVSDVDPVIHAIQFDDAAGEGEIEFKQRGRVNERITTRAQFQVLIDRWVTAGIPPPPPPPPTPEQIEQQGRDRIQNDKLLRALVIWLAGRFSIPVAQARDEIVAIYKTL